MDNKRLMVKLNQIYSQNGGKIFYGLFLMMVLESLASVVIFSSFMNLLAGGVAGGSTNFLTFIFAFLVIFVWLCLQFGFAVMLLKMTRREYSNLGFLFLAFRRLNPAGKVISAFAFIFVIITFLSRFLAKTIFLKIRPDFTFSLPSLSSLQKAEPGPETEEMLSTLPSDFLFFLLLFIGILFLLSLFVLLRYAFVFHLHFDNPYWSLPNLFRQSRRMMRGNSLRLILFALKAGGKQLAIALGLLILVNLIPEAKHSGLSLLVFFLDMAYFINLCTALTRIYLTVPLLYEEKLKIENS